MVLVKRAGHLLMNLQNLMRKFERFEIQVLSHEAEFRPPLLPEVLEPFRLSRFIRDSVRYLFCKRRDKGNESRSSCRNHIRVVFFHGSLSRAPTARKDRPVIELRQRRAEHW